MELAATHRFDAPPDAVARVLGDVAFYEQLELPDLTLLGATSPSAGHVVLRYEYTGGLDPMARRLLGGERLAWAQEVRVDGAAGGTLEFRAEAEPTILHGSATFELEASPGGTTTRHLHGELVVALPVIGAMAERRIVPGVLSRLDVEAEAVRQRLA